MITTVQGAKDNKPRPLACLSLLLLLVLYWALSCAVLWWAYDMGPLIRDGYYRQQQALELVGKMALILSILTSVVWFWVDWRKPKRRGWRVGWNITWKTWVILVAYVAIVLIRRQLWEPSQGIDDRIMYGPVVGHINGSFMSEYGFLSLLIEVIPIVALLSGGLYFLHVRALQKYGARKTTQPPP